MDGLQGLDELIGEYLTRQGLTGAVAYIDEQVRPSGSAEIGGKTIVLDHDYVLVFVDLQPSKNWMHPCRYVLIEPASRRLTTIDSDRPPAFGILPSGWRVLWRAPEVPDWQVFRIGS